jgi:hypothetical protein
VWLASTGALAVLCGPPAQCSPDRVCPTLPRAGSWPWCDDDRAPLACRPSPFGSYDHCCIIHLQGGGHTDYTCGEGLPPPPI